MNFSTMRLLCIFCRTVNDIHHWNGYDNWTIFVHYSRDFSCIFFIEIWTSFHQISYIFHPLSKGLRTCKEHFFPSKGIFYSDKNQVNSTLASKFLNTTIVFFSSHKKTKSNQLNKEKTQPANTLLAIKKEYKSSENN